MMFEMLAGEAVGGFWHLFLASVMNAASALYPVSNGRLTKSDDSGT